MKRPFSWNAGSDWIRATTSWSLALIPELLGLGERRFLFNQPLQDPLIDAQLLQQALVHVAAIGVAVRLHLLQVHAPEPVHRDFAPIHAGDDILGPGRLAVELPVRQVEDDEGENDETEAPLQPAPVSAHPIEHCH